MIIVMCNRCRDNEKNIYGSYYDTLGSLVEEDGWRLLNDEPICPDCMEASHE